MEMAEAFRGSLSRLNSLAGMTPVKRSAESSSFTAKGMPHI